MMSRMTARQPIEAAEEIFRSLGGFPSDEPAGGAVPPPARLFAAVQAFAELPFQVAEHLPEQDGFFFQYAAVKTYRDDVGFIMGIVRQFEAVDADDEHEGYSQMQAQYLFGPDPELAALGHHEDFWFAGGPEPFEQWFARITAHPAWRFVETKHPLEFEIYQEWV
jgi:hypothetical protein